MQVESQLQSDDVSIKQVLDLLREMKEESKNQLRSLESDLGKSVELCHSDISELVKKIDKQSEIIKNYETLFEKVNQTNLALTKRVKELENRVEDLEQYSRANCLEINGIPEKSNEQLMEVVKKVGSSLGLQINESDIDACHRLGQKRSGDNSGRPRGIIVKFTRRIVKEDMLVKRRIKRNFNTDDIGFTDRAAEVIYMNESLSMARRQIFNAARQLKKDGLVQFVWVRNGRVLVRAEEGVRTQVMTSPDQVEELRNTRRGSGSNKDPPVTQDNDTATP